MAATRMRSVRSMARQRSTLVQQLLSQGVPAASLQSKALYPGGQYTDASGIREFGPAVNNTAFFQSCSTNSGGERELPRAAGAHDGEVGGLSLTGSYTFAHALDNGSDPLVPGAGNAASRAIRPIWRMSTATPTPISGTACVAATYALPIGHGQHYLSSGFVGRVFEGIQISGIQQAQTGLPFDLRGTWTTCTPGERPAAACGQAVSLRARKKVSGGVVRVRRPVHLRMRHSARMFRSGGTRSTGRDS